jgi:hypothetical protein
VGPAVTRFPSVLLAASLLGCVAVVQAKTANAVPELAYPSGPYGYGEGQIYPPLASVRELYDPTGERGVRAVVVVASSATVLEAMPQAKLAGDPRRGLREVVGLFDHASLESASPPTLARLRARGDVFAASLADVAPGVVVYPTRFVIDPRTMKIVSISEGVPLDTCDPAVDPLLEKNGGARTCDG